MTPDALARLHADAAPPFERGWTAAEFAALIDGPGAVLQTEPAGFLLGRVIVDEAEILMLAVDPAHRRAGVGHRLLQRFVAAARHRGARRAMLEVAADNDPALALYGRCGFAPVGRRKGYYARPGGEAVDASILSRPV